MTDLLSPVAKPLQSIYFIVPGEVRGKKASLSRIVQGTNKETGKPYQFTSHYTDAKTRSYEAKIGYYAMEAKGRERWNISDKPLRVYLEARFKIPESYSNKRKLELTGAKYAQKPDADNLCKCWADGCAAVLFNDDKQVCEILIVKRYVDDKHPEGLYVKVEECVG